MQKTAYKTSWLQWTIRMDRSSLGELRKCQMQNESTLMTKPTRTHIKKKDQIACYTKAIETKKYLFLTLNYSKFSKKMEEERPLLSPTELKNYIDCLELELGRKLSHYSSGEYGSKKNNPHYHILLFGVTSDDIEDICATWTQGDVFAEAVPLRKIYKVVEYIGKGQSRHSLSNGKPFIMEKLDL